MGIGLNDCLPDDRRQTLRPLLARCIGTAGDGMTERRRYMALDWLIRTYTPAWLSAAGLHAACRPPAGVSKRSSTRRPYVRPSLRLSLSLNAAWDAAGAAARGAAAWAAAGAAAGAAAWAAAGDAAWDAAGDAAGAAARGRSAGRSGGRSAGRSVGTALAPTVAMLQDSAVALFERMLPTVTIPMPADVARHAQTRC
jgi:hypothetical protein